MKKKAIKLLGVLFLFLLVNCSVQQAVPERPVRFRTIIRLAPDADPAQCYALAPFITERASINDDRNTPRLYTLDFRSEAEAAYFIKQLQAQALPIISVHTERLD